MGVFKKEGVFWIDYYVSGYRKRERIGLDKRRADTVLRKRKVEIAEGKFLRPYFSGKRLIDITPAMVSQDQAHRRASLSHFGHPLKPSTVNRELAILRAMFNVA